MQRYEKYKDSGVDWIGEIPEGWFQEPFSSVFSLKSVINNKNEELLSVYLDKGVIRFSDVGEKRTNVTSEDLSKYQLVEEGDFVLNNQQAWRGSVGVSFYRGIVSPAYIVLAIKNNFDFRFLNYLLRNRSFVTHYLLCSKGVGTIQRNLYWPQLKRVYLIFPSLEEQQTIANFLDDKTAKIDQTIAIKQKEIELLKERRQILIQKAVTKGLDATVKLKDSGVDWIGEIPEHWEVRKLRFEFNLSKGLTITKENLIEEGIPCVNYGEVHSKYGFEVNPSIHPLRFVPEDYLQTNPNSLLNKGDFIFADTSEDLDGSGNFTYLNSNETVFAGYHTVIARPKKNIESRFFAYEFDSPNFRNQVRTKMKGVKVFSITQSILKDLTLWIPPYKEQKEITNYLDIKTSKIDQVILLKQLEIEKLKEYKTVLIDQVVTGKVKII